MKTRNSILLAIGMALVIGGLFSEAVTTEYAHTDDYSTLFWFGSGMTDAFSNQITEMGRPVAGIIQTYLFQLGDSLDTIRNIRILGLVGLWVLALFTVQLYYQAGQRIVPATLIAICILANPSSGVYVGWAMTSLLFHAALLAAYSGFLLQSGIDAFPESKHKAIVLFTCAAGLFLISICIYQPTIFFFLMPVLIRETLVVNRTRFAFWIPWVHVGALGLLLVSYFLLYKLAIVLAHTETWASTRGQFVANPLEQLGNLIEFPLLASFSSWAVFQPTWVLVVVRVIILMGIVFGICALFRGDRPVLRAFNLILFTVCAYLMATSIGLLQDIGKMPFRMMPFQYIICGHLFVLGIIWVHEVVKGVKLRRLVLTCVMVMAAYQLAFAQWTVAEGLIRLHAHEYKAIKDYLFQRFDGTEKFAAFLYTTEKANCPVPQIHEYGFHSTSCDWVPRSVITFLIREKGGLPPVPKTPAGIFSIQVLRIYPWQQRDLEKVPVVDSREALFGKKTRPAHTYNREDWRLRGRLPRQHPDFGEIEPYNDGWFYAPSIGYMRKWKASTYTHWSLGFITVEPDGLWINTKTKGRLKTSLDDFPVASDPLTGMRYRFKQNGYQDYSIVELDNADEAAPEAGF